MPKIARPHVYRVMHCAVLLLAATGCAANFADSFEPDAGSVDAKLGAAYGVENELVEYEMKLAGMTVGRFQIAVGSRGVIEGRPSVIVHSHASLAGAGTLLGSLEWDLTTTVDIDSGFAIAQTEDVTIDAIGHAGHDHATHTWTIADRHHNAHSAAGALRGWFTGPGAHDALDVALIDTSVPVTIADATRETIGTAIGTTPAVRYDGMLRGKHAFSVWVSDDTARVPLRLHSGSNLGAVEVELVNYTVPRDP